jgi:hypothetical protein
MKKERIRKSDGRYLIYYSFDELIVPSDAQPSARRGRLQAGRLPAFPKVRKAASTKGVTRGKR